MANLESGFNQVDETNECSTNLFSEEQKEQGVERQLSRRKPERKKNIK